MIPPAFPPSPPPERAEDMAVDNGELVETQVETQVATQISSSQEAKGSRRADNHLWGYLIPCSPTMRRLDFMKDCHEYQIGRNRSEQFGNDFVLPGMKVSEYSSA